MKVKLLFSALSIFIAFSCSFCDDWTISSDTWILPGTYNYGNVTINNGCTLVCKSATGASTGPVYINCTNLTINSNGRISADGQGYPQNQGPGSSPTSSGNGGSYGGYGADGNILDVVGPVYGSIKEPVDLGSGGNVWDGNGSYGGGSIVLVAQNEVRIDGIISANGVNGLGNNTGGSGGSINVRTKILSGSGQINANGGSGPHPTPGDGGGGRIAVYYEQNNFTGTVLARRGMNSNGIYKAGCGTIFMKSSSQINGDLIIDGANYSSDSYTTPIAGTNTFDTILLKNLGRIEITQGSVLTTTNFSSNNGSNVVDYNGGEFIISGLSQKIPNGDFIIDNLVFQLKCDSVALNNLTIKPTGQLTNRANYDAKQYWVNVVCQGNLVIEQGGMIDVTGKGYAATKGPGAGTGTAWSGGSYGGYSETVAGCTVGSVYGSETQPVDLGSGGGSFSGGGAIYLQVWENLQNDGLIKAEGTIGTSSNGTGSGGSIYIKTTNLTGSALGKMSVKGGYNGNPGWGGANGGGGRLAVYYYDYNYLGSFDTSGGGRTAQAGTSYFAQTNFLMPPRVTSIDNPAYSSAISGKRPSFKWTAPTDRENDALHFDIEITQDSSFATVPVVSASSNTSQAGFQYSSDTGITWQSFPSSGVSSNASPSIKVSYTVQQDLYVGDWYWRVRAKDVDGNAVWSTTGVLPSIIGDLVVRISSPDDSIAVYDEKIKVEGAAEQSVSQTISVNGEARTLTVSNNQFSEEVNLTIGKNTIVVAGYGAIGNYVSDTVGVYRLRVPLSEKEESLGIKGGIVRLEDWDGDSENDARIEVSEGTFNKDTKIKMKMTSGEYPVYDIKIDNQETYKLNKRIKIVLSYRGMKIEPKDEDKLSVFHSDGVKWNPIGSEVNDAKKTVSCYTNHTSKYAVMILLAGRKTSATVTPVIFTPNGDAINDMVVFNVAVENEGNVEIVIYDSTGKLVRIISEEKIKNGVSVGWDGFDANGNLAETGLYLYAVKLNGRIISTGSVVIAR